ncbi:MAG TPA: hypothetical protein VL832_28870 [Puia sp.]|nr:hypothetical protein [Puia sp.]
MGKEDRIHEKKPTTTQAAAEHSSKGGLSLPPVPVFSQVTQLMHRKKRTQSKEDGRDNKQRKLTHSWERETDEVEEGDQGGGIGTEDWGFPDFQEEVEEKADQYNDDEVQETAFDFKIEEEKKEELPVVPTPVKGKKEKKVARREKEEEAPAEEPTSKVIDRSEDFGEYGNFLIDKLELTKVPGAKAFFDWLREKKITIRFIRSNQGRGARGETFLEIKTGDHFITIDDPAKPFTGWGDITKDTEMRILIKIYKAKSEKGYVDPIHEIVVHGMRYKPLIESIHQMQTASNETESALLYHFYLEYGDISALTQHHTHGSELRKGSMKSGYAEYEPLVKEQMAIMKQEGGTRKGKTWAEQLETSAKKDVDMQAEGKGDVEADRTYEDHSMELLIAWLANKNIEKTQRVSCETLSTPDEDWINIILLYNQYLIASAQSICNSSVIQSGLGKFKKIGSIPISTWLKQGTSDFNIALLNHIATTGNFAGVPYDLEKRKTGTSVSHDQIIGGVQERLLQPEIQALINYRQALAKKMGDGSFDWEQLKADAVKGRLGEK